jgi:hydroxyacylglutathione hydrolase
LPDNGSGLDLFVPAGLSPVKPTDACIVDSHSRSTRCLITLAMPFHYRTLPVTAFQQNCSVVWCDRTRKAAVIDPGGDLPRLLAFVDEQGLALEQIWLTHAHIDHAGGAGQLARERGLPIVGPHPADQFWIDGLPQQSRMFGFPAAEAFTPTRWLHDGDTVTVGECTLQVRHCPGHTPGHVVFFEPESRRAFVGDVLFAGSIGRTDFPQGNFDQLIASITQRLWPMGDDVVFIPGHGPESSFGEERRSNPYVRGT